MCMWRRGGEGVCCVCVHVMCVCVCKRDCGLVYLIAGVKVYVFEWLVVSYESKYVCTYACLHQFK